LRSVIQATDSTWTGCTAKIAAMSAAPGTARRTSTRQSRNVAAACSATLVTW